MNHFCAWQGKRAVFLQKYCLRERKTLLNTSSQALFFARIPKQIRTNSSMKNLMETIFEANFIRYCAGRLAIALFFPYALYSIKWKENCWQKNIHPTQKRSECSQSSWWLVFMCFVLLFIAFQLNFFPLAHSSKRKKNIMLNIFSLDLRNCILNSIYPILVASWRKNVLHFLEKKIQYGLLQ